MTETDWIGRSRSDSDQITPRMIAGYRATLDQALAPGAVPLGLHWGLMPDLAAPADLGRDGHPRLGLFLPDLGLPRRMWAGGELTFVTPFQPGDLVTRHSTITDIAHKSGSSGRLAFVTVAHVWAAGDQTRITERQDIVYREEPTGPAPAPAAAPDWQGAARRDVAPDTVLLMRYSALTFNAHRIHYDLPYATGVEAYDGLVVHGPLQAIWLMNWATMLGGPLVRFAYRGLAPLTLGHAVGMEARARGDGAWDMRMRRADDVATMQATATVA
jgi:3-methylfumaryl-CoA hydratase